MDHRYKGQHIRGPSITSKLKWRYLYYRSKIVHVPQAIGETECRFLNDTQNISDIYITCQRECRSPVKHIKQRADPSCNRSSGVQIPHITGQTMFKFLYQRSN